MISGIDTIPEDPYTGATSRDRIIVLFLSSDLQHFVY